MRKWFMERGAQGVEGLKYAAPKTQGAGLARVTSWFTPGVGGASLRNQDRREVCAGSDSEWGPGWGARAHSPEGS